MLKKEINSVLHKSFTLISTLFFGYCSISASFAKEYIGLQGSSIIVNSFSGQLEGGSTTAFVGASASNSMYRPYLGGLVLPNINLGCLTPEFVLNTADGWTGVKANPNGIIVGMTGELTGSVSRLRNSDNIDETILLNGGIRFNSRGVASPIGDSSNDSAKFLCGSVSLPYQKTSYTGAGNTGWGNALGQFNGELWLYVPTNIPPGTYSLDPVGFSQGGGVVPAFNAYLPIIENGDTVTVLPPPCTISTESSINFEGVSEESMNVSTFVNYQCGDINVPTQLNAYLLAYSVNQTPLISTELPLIIDGNKPGGVVRGFFGVNAESDAGCNDASSSLQFNATYSTKLGAVVTSNQTTPLVWQLCRKGNEVPGLATASVILEIGYK